MRELTTIGRAEKVTFPTVANLVLHARIDTGAKTSSLWASRVSEQRDGLHVNLADRPANSKNTSLVIKDYSQVIVASSTGHRQVRYKVKVPVIIRGRRINATFTLADRSTQVYPVLIGRSTLHKKFLVDVSQGSPLLEDEKRHSDELQKQLKGDL